MINSIQDIDPDYNQWIVNVFDGWVRILMTGWLRIINGWFSVISGKLRMTASGERIINGWLRIVICRLRRIARNMDEGSLEFRRGVIFRRGVGHVCRSHVDVAISQLTFKRGLPSQSIVN